MGVALIKLTSAFDCEICFALDGDYSILIAAGCGSIAFHATLDSEFTLALKVGQCDTFNHGEWEQEKKARVNTLSDSMGVK